MSASRIFFSKYHNMTALFWNICFPLHNIIFCVLLSFERRRNIVSFSGNNFLYFHTFLVFKKDNASKFCYITKHCHNKHFLCWLYNSKINLIRNMFYWYLIFYRNIISYLNFNKNAVFGKKSKKKNICQWIFKFTNSFLILVIIDITGKSGHQRHKCKTNSYIICTIHFS